MSLIADRFFDVPMRTGIKFSRPEFCALVLHTQANPGVSCATGIDYNNRERRASYHFAVDPDIIWQGLPWDEHGFHVLEHRMADALGRPTWFFGKQRGDIMTIGIEHYELPDGSWPHSVCELSVILGATLFLEHPMLKGKQPIHRRTVFGHRDLDPWTRPNDPPLSVSIARWCQEVSELIDAITALRISVYSLAQQVNMIRGQIWSLQVQINRLAGKENP